MKGLIVMKLMKTALIFSLICVLVGNASVTTAEGTDCVQELLRAEAPENAVFGETVILADALQFSIPADWERSSEYDDEELCSFLYTGTDGAGRNIMFLGMEAGSELLGEELSSYIDLKNMLDEAETGYVVSSLNGIDMIFKGNEEFAAGMGLTKEAEFFAFGFASEEYEMEEVLRSDKLKADMVSIIHSMKVIDADRLMRFDASIWESSERTEKTGTVNMTFQDKFFESVTSGLGRTSISHPIYLNDTLVIYVPYDWQEVEAEESLYVFEGSDEYNNRATVTVEAVYANGKTADELEADAKKQIACCTIETKEIRYFTYLTKSAVVTAWLDDDGTLYRLTAKLDTKAGIRSEKLMGDLHQILCRLRPVHDDELELKRMFATLADADHADENPVLFQDAKFERMVRDAMDRSEDVPIYPSELETIRKMNIRSGTIFFSSEPLDRPKDIQPGVLDLANLKLFPNLCYLNIMDRECVGFEALAELPELRQLILIRTGLTDCSFLSGMTLRELDLAGNNIVDFAPIKKVKGLKELNVSNTGLASLEFVRDMDLTLLAVAGNPISDLEPISNMSGLTQLYIQDTDISSLNALRDLRELSVLYIGYPKSDISLEPLYQHDNLKQIFYWGTLSDTDRQRFEGVLW